MRKTVITKLIVLMVLPISELASQIPEGYNLWLKYTSIQKKSQQDNYRRLSSDVYFEKGSDILKAAEAELSRGMEGMLGSSLKAVSSMTSASIVVAKTGNLDAKIRSLLNLNIQNNQLGSEGFLIRSTSSNDNQVIVITANEDIGILYGVFRFLRLLQSGDSLTDVTIKDSPKIDLRVLNHWDNLDGSVERGYAGFSLWNWQKLPECLDQRYYDYARANASIGINGTVLNNVNANALILTPMYLEKVAALADIFRQYGIKVYLTARFSAPIEIGGLKTADPLEPQVQNWWTNKVEEIYRSIPDFGGFLVKANSEGQPGPQNYGRTHVDGANMMAKAIEPFNGVVMWRAFVYSEHDATDRAKQAYSEFVPFDGQFSDNVLIQTKNGPIDFQPREPFHPIFGAMPKTPSMMEFQITKEYLGFSTHLVFLPKLFEEVLRADTFQKGKGSTVAQVVDGSLFGNKISAIAGVANIGNDINWTGHPFGQADWYGYGRLAWDPYLSAETIADEWLKATYSSNPEFIEPIKKMMIMSREAVVNYMNPFGLHHLFDTGHHYGPGPWVSNLNRPEWNPTYYHKADEFGIGFDRSSNGTKAIEQYATQVADQFNDLKACPEEYLLWFHHVSWDYRLKNGQTLWNGLALKYQEGVDQVKGMIATWETAKSFISESQYNEVRMLMDIQLKEAIWWKDASLLYFQTFSKRPIPAGVDKPTKTLDYYKSLKFPFAPGIKPRWH